MRRLLVVLVLLACSDAAGPTFPGQRPFEPLPWYPDLHAEIEACLGVQGDFDRIGWLVADDLGSTPDGFFAGQWWPPHTIIVLESHVAAPITVGHEMIHEILQDRSWPNHPEHPCEPCGLWLEGRCPLSMLGLQPLPELL